MFAFFKVYDLHVWLSLLATVVLFILSGVFIYWLAPGENEKRSYGKVNYENL
jgi:hypothetical protein